MKNEPRKKTSSIAGYFIFFLTIAFASVVSLYSYILADRISGGNKLVIAIVMLLAIIFISLLCTLVDIFRRRIMIDRPVREILTATEKIASGDFSVRLKSDKTYEKYDDYDLIKENLNTMASELSKSEILKNDFVSNVSHELKTPLAIIQSYATLLQQKGLDEQTKSKYVKAVLQATTRLSDLISNVLKLNKLENQQLLLENQKIYLDEMLETAIINFEEIIDKKNITIDCDIDRVEVFSHKSYLEIVWNNLISNAIKFTDDGGKISVSVKKVGEKAVVSISDTGCGISPETGAHIFDKFYQGDSSHAQEGNGLGLSLVKKVIDLVGGEISVKSEINKGSTFTITLRGAN